MIRLAVLALMLFVAQADAATFNIRSGDHPGFSRLVIDFDTVPGWTLGRVAGGYELRLEDRLAEFGIGQVFSRISRARLSRLDQLGNGRLFLAIACDCHAVAFEHGNRLVIDLKDGAPPGDSRFESALADPDEEIPGIAAEPAMPAAGIGHETAAPPETGSASAASPAPGTIPPSETPRREILSPSLLAARSLVPRTDLAWAGEVALPSNHGVASPPAHDAAGHESEPVETRRDDRILAIQADLIGQIGRAAVQGLVEPDLERTHTMVAAAIMHSGGAPATDAGPVAHDEDLPAVEYAAEATGLANVRIESAVDRGFSETDRRAPMTPDGNKCLPDGKFAIVDWGMPPGDGASVAGFRSGIVGEFDAADPRAIVALARNYVYLTFGAEAVALLRAFDAPVPDAGLIALMARVMDGEQTGGPSQIDDQIACNGRVAMWAVLARPDLRPGDPIASNAVVTAFAELPLHLRRHLGPMLSKRLLAVGDADTVSRIHAAIVRAPGDPGEAVRMVEAEMALDAGDFSGGTGELAEIIRQDGPVAAEAVVRLIDARLDEGLDIDPGLVDSAAALAFEARGTPRGTELSRAVVRALAHRGDFERATKDLETLSAQVGSDALADLRREILILEAESAPDELFLRLVIGHATGLGSTGGDAAVRRLLARRLVELGLPETARAVLTEVPGVPAPEDRLLIARSFVADRRADMAMGYLAGLTGPEADALRAETHAISGEFMRAAEVFASLGMADGQARAAWRGEDWAAVRQVGSETERAAAELALKPDPLDAPETGGPLARNAEMLDRSRDTRRRLEELLASTARP